MPHLFRVFTVSVLAVMGSACAVSRGGKQSDIGGVPTTAQRDSAVLRDTLIADLGRLDFSRYSDPAACERAVFHVDVLISGENAKRGGGIGAARNGLSPASIEIGKRCVSQMKVESTAQNQLFFLQRLGLILGEDSLADAAVRRRIFEAPGVQSLGHVLLESMLNYLQILPSRLDKAEALAAYLYSLDDSTRIQKLQANHALLAHYHTVFDVPKIFEYSTRVINISKTLNQAEKNTWARVVYSPYLYSASAYSYLYGADSAVGYLSPYIDSLKTLGSQWDKSSISNSYARLERQANIVGSQAVQPQSFVKVGQDTMSPRPIPGKVNIYTVFDKNCGMFCINRYNIFKDIDSTFGSGNISITFVAKTIGFSFPPGVQTTKEEMDTISQSFLSFNLPGTLFIQESSFFTKPDGRRVAMPSPFEEQYFGNQTVVIDRRGIIRWLGNVEQASEAAFTFLIKRLIAR